MLENEAAQLAEFSCAKSVCYGQTDVGKPELGEAFCLFHMNVRGLASFVTEKEETITRNS